MKTVEVVDSADVRQRLLLLAIYEFLSDWRIPGLTSQKRFAWKTAKLLQTGFSKAFRGPSSHPEFAVIQIIGLPVLARSYEAELVQTRRIRRYAHSVRKR